MLSAFPWTNIYIPVKVQFDVEYMRRRFFWLDLKIIVLTFVRVLHRQGVSH